MRDEASGYPRDIRDDSRDIYLALFQPRDIPLHIEMELSPGGRLIFRIEE